MRSSWEASATNWRTFVSLRCRAASAPSTLSSMWLNAWPTWPTSEAGLASPGATRIGTWPSPLSSGRLETWVAVAASRVSGRRLRSTTRRAPMKESRIAPRVSRPAMHQQARHRAAHLAVGQCHDRRHGQLADLALLHQDPVQAELGEGHRHGAAQGRERQQDGDALLIQVVGLGVDQGPSRERCRSGSGRNRPDPSRPGCRPTRRRGRWAARQRSASRSSSWFCRIWKLARAVKRLRTTVTRATRAVVRTTS